MLLFQGKLCIKIVLSRCPKIGGNFNSPINATAFEKESRRILAEVEKDFGWMYETMHSDGTMCKVDYYVWSEVFTCPSCAAQLIFSEIALEEETGKVRKNLQCSSCKSEIKKNDMELVYEESWDPILKCSKRLPKRVPYIIAYKKGKEKCRVGIYASLFLFVNKM